MPEFNTAGDAWRWALTIIENKGHLRTTEDHQLTKEILNMQLTIKHPDQGWPIKGSGWDLVALEKYADQLMTPYNPTGFDYTYGERFGPQLELIISKLQNSKYSRRGVMTTWNGVADLLTRKHVPCAIALNFIVIGGGPFFGDTLHLTAFIRSNDMKMAWPQNVYGFWQMMERVRRPLELNLGTLTTLSVSAHVYQ